MRRIITGIDHVGIRVHNLERAREFYEFLGFEFIAGPIGPEPVAILTHPSGTTINLILNADQSDVPNVLMDVEERHAGYTHIALAVADAGKMQELLERKGITITEGPVTFPTGISLFVRDPDRNVIEFHEPGERTPLEL